MYLADEFYLIAHQDSTGQPRLHSRAAGYGLAAALLAELHLHGNLTMDDHNVTVTSLVPPPDPLAHNVLEHLLDEPYKRPVRDWLAFLGRTAVEDVAKRLARLGMLEVVETKRLWGVSRTYVPVAINDAAWPLARITTRLLSGVTRRGVELSLPDQILTGLCFATGLTRQMVWGDEQHSARQYLGQVIGGLPPPMRILVTETEIAISKTAATRG
ncbi:MAG TPA: GPP34 family phosphoprotein [Candidatus Limnocylindrales bacterium]|nr:GPP34 family phosphoprotein [Candidatus Limnocylindrales bacterium]